MSGSHLATSARIARQGGTVRSRGGARRTRYARLAWFVRAARDSWPVTAR